MENVASAFNGGTSAYADSFSSVKSQEDSLEIREVFKSDTPDGIDNLSSSELLSYVVKGNYKSSPAVRLRVLNMIYDVLGYDKENEVMLMSASQPQCKLCVASAGSGKTTAANIQIIAEKIMRTSRIVKGQPINGSNVLVLVYNNHNVGDFRKRHEAMVSILRDANIKGLAIDDNVNVTTVHSFAGRVLDTFPHLHNGTKTEIIKEYEARALLSRAANMAYKKAVKQGRKKEMKKDYSETIHIPSLYTFYSIFKESLKSVHQLNSNDQFLQLEMEEEIVEDTFSFYEKLKKASNLIDFSDLLTDCYTLLKEHPDACTKMRNFYEYVVADEVQDLSPLMFEILALLVGEEVPLMCIGDEDQSIYGFRGADMYNIIKFKEKFKDSRIYTLSRNRRCCKEIFDYGRFTIQQNSLRFHKPLGYVKEGGHIEFLPYSTPSGQLTNIINRIAGMTEKERDSTVICTRENEGNAILVQVLATMHIPHYVVGGLGMNAFNAYSHELYKHVSDILNVLYMPMDIYAQLNLYKVMPLNKSEMANIVGYDTKSNKLKYYGSARHFAELDYGQLSSKAEYRAVLKRLREISMSMSTMPMKEYMKDIFSMMFKYFWRTRRYFKSSDTIDDIFEKLTFRFFSSDLIYKDFISKYSEEKTFCKTNQSMNKGIAISTFHKLKGLEFDTVFLTNMDNEIFPNFHSIESRNCSDHAKLELKESETRLAYVAITRARNNLYVYYNEDNPSVYVRSYIGAKEIVNVYDAVDLSTFDDASSFEDYGGVDLEDPTLTGAISSMEQPLGETLSVPTEPVEEDSLDDDCGIAEDDFQEDDFPEEDGIVDSFANAKTVSAIDLFSPKQDSSVLSSSVSTAHTLQQSKVAISQNTIEAFDDLTAKVSKKSLEVQNQKSGEKRKIFNKGSKLSNFLSKI